MKIKYVAVFKNPVKFVIQKNTTSYLRQDKYCIINKPNTVPTTNDDEGNYTASLSGKHRTLLSNGSDLLVQMSFGDI